MLVTLNTQDILNSLVASLANQLNVDPDELHIGVINGEVTAVAAIGESVPEGLFDNDEPEVTAEATEAEPKQPKKTKRTRRTRAQIEADEAAAKLKSEAVAPATVVTEPATEVKPAEEVKPEAVVEEVKAPVTVEEEQLFADPGATAQPFGGEPAPQTADAEDLFGQTETKPAAVVQQGEAGFVKPAVDDDTINLFS